MGIQNTAGSFITMKGGDVVVQVDDGQTGTIRPVGQAPTPTASVKLTLTWTDWVYVGPEQFGSGEPAQPEREKPVKCERTVYVQGPQVLGAGGCSCRWVNYAVQDHWHRKARASWGLS